MCGIIGYLGHEDPKGVLLDGLKRLEYRGYDSAGIAIHEKDKVEVFRCEGRLANLEKKLGSRTFVGSCGVGHTRWATHGAPTEINAHPHRIGHITLVHNGIIENYIDHRDALLEMGRKIHSETDSEIVAHLFDLEVSQGRSLQDAILNILPRLKGSYAFVVMNDKEPGVLAGIRNGAPLLLGIGKNECYLASDVQAILHRTNQIVYLEDRQFAICRQGHAELFSEKGEKLKPVIKTLDWTPEQMDKGGYRHYMLKEIHEQPQAIAQTVEGNIDKDTGIISMTELGNVTSRLESIRSLGDRFCATIISAMSPTTFDDGVTLMMSPKKSLAARYALATSAQRVSKPSERACSLRLVNCPPGISCR